MALISISIDIAESTKIKKTIKDFSSKDPSNIIESYKAFLIQLYNLEMNFYYQLVNDNIDLNNVLVIKTIGDEIWMVYNLEKENIEYKSNEFNEIVHAIIGGLIDMNHKDYHITIPERRILTGEEEADYRLQEKISFKYISIVPKVYVDLIENYEEANKIRYETFNRRFASLFPYQNRKNINYADREVKYPIYLNNLNFGMSIEGSQKIAYRFDPIGFEIDKFFRCTKHSKPGIITIGQALFDKMLIGQAVNANQDEFFIENLTLPHGDRHKTSNAYYSCISRLIDKKDLKGIDENYRIYYLYKKDLLPSKIRSEKEADNYLETIELIGKYGKM